ncbi:LodA/GoxA family CTQ-dependent oxidase [Nostoc sp.]|uniref:LodA/GoxA family CTQ-dependent oxidase n=1 Tax=Nostoc sp. TaxID=1180 RepID=UPI003FA5E7DF
MGQAIAQITQVPFCPGGEVGWLIRNPSVYKEPYRLKADPDYFQLSPNCGSG